MRLLRSRAPRERPRSAKDSPSIGHHEAQHLAVVKAATAEDIQFKMALLRPANHTGWWKRDG